MSHFSALFLNRIFQNLFYFQKGFENGRKKLILKKNWLKKQKKTVQCDMSTGCLSSQSCASANYKGLEKRASKVQITIKAF